MKDNSERKNTYRILFTVVLGMLFLAPAVVGAITYPSAQASSSNSQASSSQVISPGVIQLGPLSSNGPTCTPTAICPSMMQEGYGISDLLSKGVNGTGQTIVIVDACGEPNISSDLKTFDSTFKLPNPTLNVIDFEGPINETVCSSWAVETALDVEWSHVMAPGATIDLLEAVNGGASAMYAGWTYALKRDLGDQISDSWGGAGCNVRACNNTIGEGIGPCTLTNGTQGVDVTKILDQAAKQNVTILGAGGDGGWWGLGSGNEEPVPADCQGVLTVGGTQISLTTKGLYKSEIAWSGSGGGYVTAPKEPEYQIEANITDKFGTLAKPDVSADASCGSPVWVIEDGGWGGVCGTSLATPLWAGFMADVNQIRAEHNLFPAGFVNPFLYTVVYTNSTLYKSDFHDIKEGSNGWPARKGWDAATGLGSFVAQNLAETLGTSPDA